jgi:hypothetical protein
MLKRLNMWQSKKHGWRTELFLMIAHWFVRPVSFPDGELRRRYE